MILRNVTIHPAEAYDPPKRTILRNMSSFPPEAADLPSEMLEPTQLMPHVPMKCWYRSGRLMTV
jgi:hypothetical protein